ncbi:glycosyltransferase PgfM1 [Streptococcus ovuberis]|uniref:YfhO family protein n=1 Tax=Streptococcus ovuberis TaxID=1936207 RepID=A0A7X6MYE0_9STRE|nr:YfhO family protein [Streptococcus ovuberis]NKZ19994.1 YfhO family protein [Streptococcus ovuberis]
MRINILSKLKSIWQAVRTNRQTQILIASTLAPMLLMALAWIVNGFYPFGRKTFMAVDFGQQYIGLYSFLKRTVLTGDWSGFFYSFSKSIGGSMIGIWGFNLISPFNIFYIILPLTQFKWAIFLSIWLRYGATGLAFSYLLIKRYKALDYNPFLVPVLASAYAMSGMIVSYQMNPIFYDAMIMLPLVILYLEEALDGKRNFRYLMVLALSLFLHFYMGFMICLFVALYACYYQAPAWQIKGSFKEKSKAFFMPLLRVVGESVLAIGSIFFLLYPIFLNLLRSKGAYDSPMTFSWAFQIKPLDILSKLVVGGFDDVSGWSTGPNLPNIYVGALALVGFFLFFRYATAHLYRKMAAAIISVIFVLSFSNEFVNKIWHMGQNPAGFFFRFSWIFSFFIVLLAYQALREEKKLSWIGWATGLGLTVASLYYVQTHIKSHKFTQINAENSKAIVKFVGEHSVGVFFFLALIFSGLVWYIWKHVSTENNDRTKSLLLCLAVFIGIWIAFKQGIMFHQLFLTAITFFAVLAYLALRPASRVWLMALLALTGFELSYNAYLSQRTSHYDDAFKFTDGTENIQKLSDVIKVLSNEPFYRVASEFLLSKNDPFLVDYPGLSNFSSNMEKSTIQLFGSLGDVGGNASTYYANGTPLTDALYGVRYFLVRKDYTEQDMENHPDWQFFGKYLTRKDLMQDYHKVYENNRFEIYENPDVLSIAFGTNAVTESIKFGTNNPVANQNIILSSMSGVEDLYFEPFGFQHLELENMEEAGVEGKTLFNRIDKTKPGKVIYRTVLQSDMTYYFQAPNSLRDSIGKIGVLLNDRWYNYSQRYDQVQLWNIASNQAGQEVKLTFEVTKDDQLDLTGMAFVRSDANKIKSIMAERKKQSMEVTKFTNTKVEGMVNITDNSDVMMTSIPYNPGWTVKVDGEEVKTKEAWESLLSFPITAGKHKIEMSFTPDGFWQGVLISMVSIGIVVVIKWRTKTEDKDQVKIA